jgi:hypothetical protein
MPSAGFEPAIPATKRPQTYALDRTATYRERLYHGVRFSVDLHVMDEDTFQNK